MQVGPIVEHDDQMMIEIESPLQVVDHDEDVENEDPVVQNDNIVEDVDMLMQVESPDVEVVRFGIVSLIVGSSI